jgi:hypothetical protein
MPTPKPTLETSDPVGSEGGSVTFDAEKIQIDVPQNTLDSETQFTYLAHSSPPYSTGGLRCAGISFQLSAHEMVSGDPVTTFDPELQVTIRYDLASLGDLPAESLRLYYWDTNSALWQDVVTTCMGGAYERNFDQHWFSVPLCHLSEFAVLGETQPGEPGYNIYLPLMIK